MSSPRPNARGFPNIRTPDARAVSLGSSRRQLFGRPVAPVGGNAPGMNRARLRPGRSKPQPRPRKLAHLGPPQLHHAIGNSECGGRCGRESQRPAKNLTGAGGRARLVVRTRFGPSHRPRRIRRRIAATHRRRPGKYSGEGVWECNQRFPALQRRSPPGT